MLDNVKDKIRDIQPAIPDEGSENIGGIGHDISREIVDPSLANPPVIFSSQKTSMDDLTSRGIETRIGIPKYYLPHFGTKELIDNAVDLHETQYRNYYDEAKPEVRVQIGKEAKAIRILVRNSDPYRNEQGIFTKEKLERIFDLDRIYSSKRYQFRISRGALGDALKEVLRIPYILATEGQDKA